MLVYRKTQESDRKTLEEWVARDKEHCSTSTAEVWLPQEHADCYLVSDDKAEPLFFFRVSKSMRIDIQFPSEADRRMPKALDEFTRDMKRSAKQSGFKELIFDSVFPRLIKFVSKRGFKPSPNEQVCRL